jgi:hypothetical protein
MWKTRVKGSDLYGIRYTDGSTFPCDVEGTVYANDLGKFENAWKLVKAETAALSGNKNARGSSILSKTFIYDGLSLLDLKKACAYRSRACFLC